MRICIAAFVVALICCLRAPTQLLGADIDAQPAEIWAALPTDKWPQLVLTNDGTFDGHTAMNGASSFLMRMPDSTIVVGTAKHLIKDAGGVKPPVSLPDLDKVLTRWNVFPRTKPNDVITAKGLAETANHELRHDWLLLNLTDPRAKLPSTPLIPRLKPVETGETIYLIGVPYSDEKSAQNVYKGVVTSRPYKTFFKYEFSPPVHIPGFSGAPIVDSNGLLVGHGVSRFPLKQKDGLEVEFGGEDASVAVELWKQRNNPPAATPATLLHTDLPEGWENRKPKLATAIKMGRFAALDAYVELFAYSKDDFEDPMEFSAWARAAKIDSAKSFKLDNRQDTELKEQKVGDRITQQFDVTGSIKNVDIHYHVVMLELNGCYCKFIFWCGEKNWAAAVPACDKVVEKLN